MTEAGHAGQGVTCPGSRRGVLELCPCNVSAVPTLPQVLLLAPVRRHFPCLAIA